MNHVEQLIRDLPLRGPSIELDQRMEGLLAVHAAARSPSKAPWRILVATALAAGMAGFVVGYGSGQWAGAPPRMTSADSDDPNCESPSRGETVSLVQITDARIGAGLDFSRSPEPFRVQPVLEEGS